MKALLDFQTFEESRVLLESYRVLLQKALGYLWERAKVERKEVKRMKAVNHKPMRRPKGTSPFRAGRRSVLIELLYVCLRSTFFL